MNEIVNRYEDIEYSGGDWSYLVKSNEELNQKFLFHIMRDIMGGNRGVHKTVSNECGRNTI